MRATQKFIDDNFESLIIKVKVTNPTIETALKTYDPELQYRILRVLDRMDTDLFSVSVFLGTPEWLEELCESIVSFEAKTYLGTEYGEPDPYKVSGYNEDEVELLLKDGRINKAIERSMMANHMEDAALFRKLQNDRKDILKGIRTEVEVDKKRWYQRPLSDATKTGICAGFAGLIVGALGLLAFTKSSK